MPELIDSPAMSSQPPRRPTSQMPSARPTTVVVAVAGPMARADLPAICGEVVALLEATGADVALCDVGALPADAAAVDALARIQLAARRAGRQVVLCRVADDLRDLLAFVGLGGVLRIEPGGQSEQREQRVGVEEERELDDPPA
jgi:ABC-type transporter Mla MlaB component